MNLVRGSAVFRSAWSADAVLAIVDQPDAAERTRELWGDRAAFLPYVMPGFVLAQRILELRDGVLHPGSALRS